MKASLTNWLRVVTGGCRWWLPAEQQQRLLGPGGLRLGEWLQAGQARVIKKGPHRVVYRVELPDLVFYLKHNLLPDLVTWLRQLVRPSKARIEYDRVQAVAARGLPTVVPLALGEQSSFLGAGESFLLTQSLENTAPLHAFLARLANLPEGAAKTRWRQTLAFELGRLLGRIHQAGIEHNDLHTGNLLVRDEGEGQFSLYLIDLDAVKAGQPLSWKQSRANLAMLNRWFVFRASRSDRLRFWRAYCATRLELGWREQEGGPPQRKRMARVVEEQTRASISVFCRRFDQRCLKTTRNFRKIDAPGWQGHMVAEVDAGELARLLADPEAPFRAPGAQVLKEAAASSVVEMDLRVNGQTRRVIYKRFGVVKWSAPLANWARPAAGLRSWYFGHALLNRALPTPRPLLFLQRRHLGLDGTAYLVTEKVEGAQNLCQFVEALPALDPGEARRLLRRRIDQVARVLRELHASQFANRDPKAPNWLIGHPAPASDCRAFGGVWMIDLVGLSQHRRLSRSRRVKNLARLNASFHASASITRADRLRFLRIYLQWNLVGKEGWKDWWRAIARLSQAKAVRNARKGRVLK